MTDRLRVGLVGCGGWGGNMLRDLRLLDCIVEVADPDIQSRNVALERGARVVVSSFDQWQLSAFDGFVVAAPAPEHGALVNQLLAAGRPIFCEKPLTCDTASARHIAEQGSDRVFVMHKWRYHPGIETIVELARSGRFGQVQEIFTRRLQWTAPGAADTIWALVPHDLSIVYGILGCLPQAVAATGQSGSDGRPRSLVGLLRDEGGPAVAIHVAANWPQKERSVWVSFEQASVQMNDPMADHLKVFCNRGQELGAEERLSISTESPLIRELRAFTNHLMGGPSPKTTVAEGALVVESIESLRRLAGFQEQ